MENKKSRKRLFITLGIVGGAVLTTLFVLYVVFVLYYIIFLPRPYDGVTDTNGLVDTSLAIITQEEIINGEQACSAYNVSGGVGRGEKTKAEIQWEDLDYDQIHYKFGKITGIKTMHASKIESGTLILDISSELTAGNAEIIILVDDQYHSHVPVSGKQTVTLDDVAGKTVLVRIGCEAAQLELTIERRIEE